MTDPAWAYVGSSGVNGIQLRSRRLVVACWMTYENWYPADSFVMYTDDHGATWQQGSLVSKGNGDECTVVECKDGSVFMSIRSTDASHHRGFVLSTDGGQTWSKFARDAVLVGWSTQGSVIGYGGDAHAPERFLLSMPACMTERFDLVVRVSNDEGGTWPVKKLLHPGPSAYSNLVGLPDGTIGCLYEGGKHFKYEFLIFARFSLEWLLGPTGSPFPVMVESYFFVNVGSLTTLSIAIVPTAEPARLSIVMSWIISWPPRLASIKPLLVQSVRNRIVVWFRVAWKHVGNATFGVSTYTPTSLSPPRAPTSLLSTHYRGTA